jgi:hypothetical protein
VSQQSYNQIIIYYVNSWPGKNIVFLGGPEIKYLLLTTLLISIILITGCDTKTEMAAKQPTISPPAASGSQTVIPTASSISSELILEHYDGGFFTIEKPQGWNISTAGSGSTLAFCVTDPASLANRIFYFNEIGPVYLAEEQKTVDKNYMDMGGYKIQWFEMPVVNPLTPENFLANFHLIAQTEIATRFLQNMPTIEGIDIISAQEEPSPIPGGQTKTIRALFKQDEDLGEGIFYITVAPVIPLTGFPSGGIGYGFCLTGITSTKSDFINSQEKLTASLKSLNISQAYINACLNQQQQQLQGILKAGDTLSETSDIIMNVWENRSRSEDILSEKRSDSILGNDRVYNPETGTVYEVPLEFYDAYDTNRDQYNMNNLELLPENDWGLWTAPSQPGTMIN